MRRITSVEVDRPNESLRQMLEVHSVSIWCGKILAHVSSQLVIHPFNHLFWHRKDTVRMCCDFDNASHGICSIRCQQLCWSLRWVAIWLVLILGHTARVLHGFLEVLARGDSGEWSAHGLVPIRRQRWHAVQVSEHLIVPTREQRRRTRGSRDLRLAVAIRGSETFVEDTQNSRRGSAMEKYGIVGSGLNLAVVENEHMAWRKKRQANLKALLERMFRRPSDASAILALLPHRRDIVPDSLERLQEVVAFQDLVWYRGCQPRTDMVRTHSLFHSQRVYGFGQHFTGAHPPDLITFRVPQGVIPPQAGGR